MKKILSGAAGVLVIAGILVFNLFQARLCEFPVLSVFCNSPTPVVSQERVLEARDKFDGALTDYADFYGRCEGIECYREALPKLDALDTAFVSWTGLARKVVAPSKQDTLERLITAFGTWLGNERDSWEIVKGCATGDQSDLSGCLAPASTLHDQEANLLAQVRDLSNELSK